MKSKSQLLSDVSTYVLSTPGGRADGISVALPRFRVRRMKFVAPKVFRCKTIDPLVDLTADSTVKDRVFGISENFIAMVSAGPLVEGHTLVCPRWSATCVGAVIRDHKLLAEFLEMRDRVDELLTRVFGHKPLVFEHGGASATRPVGC